jgi:hypothetical protein
MQTATYPNSRIGYNITKFSQRIHSVLLDLHERYANLNELPAEEDCIEICKYLRSLKSLSKYDSFSSIVKNFNVEYRIVDKFCEEIQATRNPYRFGKKLYELSQSSLKWVIKNNPPCSELSIYSPLFLEKCV